MRRRHHEREPISRTLRFEILSRDNFTCRYCGASAPDVVLHVDHILAVARGGASTLANLITACQPCNSGKGVREVKLPGFTPKPKKCRPRKLTPDVAAFLEYVASLPIRPNLVYSPGRVGELSREVQGLLAGSDGLFVKHGRVVYTQLCDTSRPRLYDAGPAEISNAVLDVACLAKSRSSGPPAPWDVYPLPAPLIRQIQRDPTHGIRRIDSVLRHPTIDSAGRVIAAHGYDAASAFYLDIKEIAPHIAPVQACTRTDAYTALDHLRAALPRFVYTSMTADTAHDYLVAQVLEHIAGPGLGFQSPATVIGGPSPSGKSLCAQVPYVAAMGIPCGAPFLRETPENLRAEMSAYLKYDPFGDMRTFLLDGAHAADTSVINLLQQAERKVVITGLEEHLLALPAVGATALYTQMVPAKRGTKYPGQGGEDEMFERLAMPVIRGPILFFALTLLRSYILYGQDASIYPAPFPGFEAWDRYIRRAILWAGGNDICADPVAAMPRKRQLAFYASV